MFPAMHRVCRPSSLPSTAACVLAATLLALAASAYSQQPAPSSPDQQLTQTAPPQTNAASLTSETAGAITEDELKQMLVGKTLYLRGGYLDSALSFNEHGALIGHSPQGSYTLSLIQIDRVRLAKHKVTLEGIRYGLHFLGALPYEDPASALDKVRITPKKKIARITIDREVVIKPKKVKAPKGTKGKVVETPASQTNETTEADDLKSEIAATPEADRPIDTKSITTTTSPAHATRVLKQALDTIFAPGLDEHMMAAMPDFWKLYYQAAAAKTDYSPTDATVQRQTTVDQKARLLTSFEPESNEYAQDNGVAGMALYHTVIGADGKPQEIAVGRPIGFGLDENAVAAIRDAKFEPAVKDGKTVPVLLDLVVQFRIYSKRTAATVATTADASDKSAQHQLPGPYTVQISPQQ
jgi:outer membrane biosynthesis protein TonB